MADTCPPPDEEIVVDSGEKTEKPADTRSQSTIETEMEASRQRLAGTIDQLTHRVHPKTIATREVNSVKAHYVDAQGSPRTDNILKTVGVVAGVVAVFVVVRLVAR